MIISTKQREMYLAKYNERLSLSIQDERIDNVLTAKYLGIQVDEDLNWKGNIKALLWETAVRPKRSSCKDFIIER